jgi:hypothetical protein
MPKIRWFQMVASGVLILFLSIIAFVIMIAYTRRSGSTGLDMAKIQQIRYEAQKKS